MSIDGYIAGKNGETDWIITDPDIDFSEIASSFDTVLIGRKTYDSMRELGGIGMPGLQTIVFSSTLRQSDFADVIISNDPAHTLAVLNAKPGKDIWLFGGGSLFRSLLELELVDSIEVSIIPVLLGDGLPLLPRPEISRRLKLLDHKIYSRTGIVRLKYEIA